ncbi:MAG: AAA family ATPase [Gammaproteobacteria bacterium]|nr:AAA family ATPase [Gammaproteobacteria bacterium]
MYTEYFGLTEEPFSIAANPRFLYMSARHREALAHLVYGIRSDSGFVLLTGEVGTGKTTVCRCLLEQMPDNTDVAFILNPRVSVNELLNSICDELGIAYPPRAFSVKTYVDAINRHLLERHAGGRNTVVIIDEAQNLSIDVLEQLRLLTNLETNERKLMRIILIGQPELETMLSRPELRQVQQRITARYHLEPLHRSEIGAYVLHRLAVAGRREPLFSPRVLNKLYRKTGGIPRLINVVCDRALLGAYVTARHKVNGPILDKAAKEVQGRLYRPAWVLPVSIAASVLLVGAATAAALFYANDKDMAMLLPKPAAQLPSMSVEMESPVAEPPALSEEQVVMVTVPEPHDPPPSPPQWPEKAGAADHALAAAYTAQFKQWNIPFAVGNADPCAHAATLGLRCYSGIGNLGSLVGIDRPAILTLVDDEGREYQATLLALDTELATLAFAHGTETVAIKDLEARWQGHYQLLWRASPLGHTVLRPGRRNSDVLWLTKNLVAAGAASLQVQNTYDAEVVAAVRAFQREQGLVADGIAGRQTLIQLNSAIDESVPRLGTRGDG